MSRIRSVHPGLFTDEAFMSASMAARVAMIGIWTECDDHGVFEHKPLVLKARIFPADNLDMAGVLAELAGLDCIQPFTHDGKSYGLVRNFCRFQRPKKPSCRFPLPAEYRAYVGLVAESEAVTATESATTPEAVENEYPTPPPPVPHSSPTSGEIAPQMEDGKGEEGGRKKGGGGSARARARATVHPPPEPDPSPPEVPEPPPDPGPSPFGTPIDGWVPRPGSIAPDDLPVLNAFAAEHREAGTFSTDWDAAFARYRAAAGAGKSPKPHAKPRLELTKRPEPPVGQRLLITDEAFRLADAVLAAARIEEGSRGSFGAPALMQAWLAAWSADTILSTVRNVMADGRERPSTLKYFERAIARAHAELAGPRPVATAAEVREIAHATRHKTNSVAAAAAELAAEFAALSGGGTDDGAGQGAVAGGTVPQVGCG